MTSTETPDTVERVLDTTHRCDRCGPSAQATVRVILTNGPLELCNHCYNKHKPAIAGLGYVEVIDERELFLADWSKHAPTAGL